MGGLLLTGLTHYVKSIILRNTMFVNQDINQKAQEITSAVLRLAAYVRRRELRASLERSALRLLEETTGRKFESVVEANRSLLGLVQLARSLYELDPANADILILQLEGLELAIGQFAGLDVLTNLENHFSSNSASKVVDPESRPATSELSGLNGANGNGNGNVAINVAIRQGAIIDKIRQSGKTTLKDMLVGFPEFSERTIRYDLQKLCSNGIVERVGNGGPTTYYQLGNPAIPSDFQT